MKFLSEPQVKKLSSLTWKEKDEIGGIAFQKEIPFHQAYLEWKKKTTDLTNWCSEQQ